MYKVTSETSFWAKARDAYSPQEAMLCYAKAPPPVVAGPTHAGLLAAVSRVQPVVTAVPAVDAAAQPAVMLAHKHAE